MWTKLTGSLWQYLSLGLGTLALFFGARAYWAENKALKKETELQKLVADQEREARELVQNASQVMVDGLNDEAEVTKVNVDTRNRTHFE